MNTEETINTLKHYKGLTLKKEEAIWFWNFQREHFTLINRGIIEEVTVDDEIRYKIN
jgi:hypothetical protein